MLSINEATLSISRRSSSSASGAATSAASAARRRIRLGTMTGKGIFDLGDGSDRSKLEQGKRLGCAGCRLARRVSVR